MNGGANQSSALYSYVMPLVGGYDANGNLLTAVDSVMGQWNYTYDSLNRLTGAQAPVSQPSFGSGYFAGIPSEPSRFLQACAASHSRAKRGWGLFRA